LPLSPTFHQNVNFYKRAVSIRKFDLTGGIQKHFAIVLEYRFRLQIKEAVESTVAGTTGTTVCYEVSFIIGGKKDTGAFRGT
jgi:hypothetical protein